MRTEAIVIGSAAWDGAFWAGSLGFPVEKSWDGTVGLAICGGARLNGDDVDWKCDNNGIGKIRFEGYKAAAVWIVYLG